MKMRWRIINGLWPNEKCSDSQETQNLWNRISARYFSIFTDLTSLEQPDSSAHVRKNKAVFTHGWGEFAQQHWGQLGSIIQCWGRIEASIHQAQAWVSTSGWKEPFLNPVHKDACTDYNNQGLHTCKCPSTWTGTTHWCELLPASEITSSNYKYPHR